MPPAKPSGFFHIEERLDVGEITDVQDIRSGTADLAFVEEHEYQGVLLVSVATKRRDENASKRQKLEVRAVVLGQSQSEPGKVVFYTRPSKVFQTVVGTDMKQSGGIGVGHIHWCSGLQVKWVPHVTTSTRVETGLFKEKAVQDARVKLAKELFELLDEEREWSDVNWDEIESRIDDIQYQLDAANSPKQRQQKRDGEASHVNKNGKLPAKGKIQASQGKVPEEEEPIEVENWTDNSKHVVRNCKFDVDQSVNLSDEEKIRVKTLMTEYITKEPADFQKHNHELAKLLNKAFVTHFDISILHNFTKAREVNLDLSSLHTFASFAAWWKQNEVGLHSTSCTCLRTGPTGPPASAEPVPDKEDSSGQSFLGRCRNMFAYVFKGI
ncbi:hypothetical protein KCU99_g8766, partial [Aureobasidium melanogenum]